MDLKKYWREARALEQSLPEYVWMVSVADVLRGHVGEAIVEVGAAIAAQLLIARSHRLATEEEVRAERERQERAKRSAEVEGLRKKGRVVVEV